MPSEPYTPTTDEVRREWAERRADGYSLVLGDAADSVALAEFDRWLAAHDAEVRADQTRTDAAIARRFAEQSIDPRTAMKIQDVEFAIRAQSEEANR